MCMLDSIRNSKTTKPVGKGSLEERARNHRKKEMKLWLSVAGTCVVILGVWVLTFRLPVSPKPPKNQDISELKSELESVAQNLKEGWQEIQHQRANMNTLALSDEKLSLLARELVAGATTSSTTLEEVSGARASTTDEGRVMPKLP